MTLLELALKAAVNGAGEFKYVRLSKEDAAYMLSMLKEQEAVAPIPPTDESDLWKCGNCNHQLFRATHQRYCEMCGRRVKWNA